MTLLLPERIIKYVRSLDQRPYQDSNPDHTFDIIHLDVFGTDAERNE